MKRAVLFLFLCILSSPSWGQDLLAFAPWEARFDTYYSSERPFSQFGVTVQRSVPVETLLPQVTADSYINALKGYVGSRFLDQKHDRVRFQLMAADIRLQRAFTSGGVKLLDYNQADELERSLTWIEVTFGPGFHYDGQKASFWGRITASGSVASLKPGTFLFSNNADASSASSGLNYAISGFLGTKLADRIVLSANVFKDEARHSSFSHSGWSANGIVQVSSKWRVATGFTSHAFDLGASKNNTESFEFSIQYSPSGAR